MRVGDQTFEEYIAELTATYDAAETEVMAVIARRLARGITDPGWADAKLSEIVAVREQVRKIMASRTATAPDTLADGIRRAFQSGFPPIAQTPFRVQANQSAIAALVRETTSKLGGATLNVLRGADDAYRRIIAETTAVAATGSVTRAVAADRALERFADDGVGAFFDTRGRKWGIAEYTDMATRSAFTRAHIEGNLARYQSEGYELVIVSISPEPCSICDPFEGKVFSVGSNRHPKYPPLQSAIDGGLFHPNCGHRVTPYIPGLTKVPERKPKKEREQAYNERQQQRSLERQIRKWKKRSAVAIDPASKKRADAKVREYQGKMRGFLDRTGRLRQSRRESMGINPPRPGPPRKPRLPAFDPNNPPGAGAGTNAILAWARQKYPNIEWEFPDAKPRNVQAVVHQLDRLAHDWPDVVAGLRYVGMVRGPDARYAWDWNDPQHEHVTAYANIQKAEWIGFNPKWMNREYDEFVTAMARGNNGPGPRWSTADTMEHVVTHEFGHIVDGFLRRSRAMILPFTDFADNGSVSGVLTQWHDAWMKRGTAKTLSRYAMGNGDSVTRKVESFAESFAKIYHHDKKEWGTYTKGQYKLFEILHPARWVPGVESGNAPLVRDIADPDERADAREQIRKLRDLLELD